MLRNTIYFLGLLLLSHCGQNESVLTGKWQDIRSENDLWQFRPDRIASVFKALDLSQPTLSNVNIKLSQGDTVAAAKALLKYYSRLDRRWVLTAIETTAENFMETADALVLDSIIREGNRVKIPLNYSQGWQWDYTGPLKDDEFAYSLNGHQYLPALYMAQRELKDSKYVKTFDRLMKDWVFQHPLPEKGDSIYIVLDTAQHIDYRDIGEVEWRTIQAGQRLGSSWPQLFYAFQNEDDFSPATRLLMLSSMCEQAEFLKQYHKFGHNWTTMEMNGLALFALAFPEFKKADEWAAYSLSVMSDEINRQVYPDGVQTEVATKTQWVALQRFESIANNFQKANRTISLDYMKGVEKMYNYLAYSMRPDGHQPLNSDSDRDDLRERVLIAAKKFSRADWQWIATNGKLGVIPSAGPSLTFPWAGIHIMRNGWDDQSAWSFFDNGPYGTGHQHRDKLHLSVSAFGKDLLVDGGRFTHQDYFSFDPTIWRGYFRSSFSHNVILVDGNGQNASSTRANTPLVEGDDFVHKKGFDYAYGTFSDGFENVNRKISHSRSVLYLHDKYWVVLDHIDTDQPRKIQVLWHYAPDCEVVLEENEAASTSTDNKNLRIVPAGNVTWEIEVVKGQEEPFKQGWYSETYGSREPNPTVIYSAELAGPVTFAWILVPADGTVPHVNTVFRERGGIVTVTIDDEGSAPVNFDLPIRKNTSRVRVY
jgi:hypothetical protein